MIAGWRAAVVPMQSSLENGPTILAAQWRDLEREAIDQALQTEVDGVKTWVMRAEYLVAIALQTRRVKDHVRILQFPQQDAVDQCKLQELLK